MLIALSQLLEIVTPYEDVPSLRILMGGIATDPFISMLFGSAPRVGCAFERCGRAACDVLRRERHRATLRGDGSGRWGEHWHGAQPSSRRRTDRRGRRSARRGRQHHHAPCRGGGGPAAPFVDRAATRADRTQSFARGRRFPHCLQRRAWIGVPAAPGTVRAPARTDVAGPDRSRRPRSASLSRRGGDGNAFNRTRPCR